MTECRSLAAWAETLPMVEEATATADQIENHLEYLATALPSRTLDNESGKRRFAVYVSMLIGHSDKALAHMSRAACKSLDWFPTVKQCLDLIGEYCAPETVRDATLRICGSFAQDAYAQWLANVRAGQPLGDVPESWLRMAVEAGPVRRLADGSFVSRALFVGPTMERKFQSAMVAAGAMEESE